MTENLLEITLQKSVFHYAEPKIAWQTFIISQIDTNEKQMSLATSLHNQTKNAPSFSNNLELLRKLLYLSFKAAK